LGVSPSPNFFSIANYGKFPCSHFLKLCTAVRREVPLLAPMRPLGSSGDFGELGDFFNFWKFSIPSGGPICARGAPVPLQYDALGYGGQCLSRTLFGYGLRFWSYGPLRLKSGFRTLKIFARFCLLPMRVSGANTP